MDELNMGFIVRGGPECPRKLCIHARAFAACCEGHEGAPLGTEAYLSAFSFGADDLVPHFEEHGSPKGFDGPCGGAHVWLDFDGPGALDDARRVCTLAEQCGADGVLAFFSGGKGFHVGIPTAALGAVPSRTFNATAKAFAAALATEAGAAGTFDGSIYDKQRIFRAPNSRHSKSGLCKIRLDLEALLGMSQGAIKALALEPVPFEVPEVPGPNAALVARWQSAISAADQGAARRADFQRAAAAGNATLSALTRRYLREGADIGERASRCFEAAANLSECGAPAGLVLDLLEEIALDSGLTPSEAKRQISCGIAHGGRAHA